MSFNNKMDDIFIDNEVNVIIHHVQTNIRLTLYKTSRVAKQILPPSKKKCCTSPEFSDRGNIPKTTED